MLGKVITRYQEHTLIIHFTQIGSQIRSVCTCSSVIKVNWFGFVESLGIAATLVVKPCSTHNASVIKINLLMLPTDFCYADNI